MSLDRFRPSNADGESNTTVSNKPAASVRPSLRSTPLIELQAALQRAGFPAWRAKQVFQWVFKHDVRSFDEMTNVPKEARAVLEEAFRWGGIGTVEAERRASDGTVKFLFRLDDGNAIESVLMPNEEHYTLCISSQSGCPLKCTFCLTGLIGLSRNLAADEIVDQVLYARRYLRNSGSALPLRNIVFMGMGEPLLNVEAVIEALRLLTRPDGCGFSPKRITVSTVGIVPGIDQLAAAETNAKLAISLNATTDEVRREIMPITRKYPIAAVLEACRRFPLPQRRRITYEYVMLEGVNDTPEDARRLVKLLHGIPCKVNLIPFNEHAALPYRRPSEARIEAFREILVSKNMTAPVRYSKGPDIEAACGQLAGGEKLTARVGTS